MKIDNALINSSPEEMGYVRLQYKPYIAMVPTNTAVNAIAIKYVCL